MSRIRKMCYDKLLPRDLRRGPRRQPMQIPGQWARAVMPINKRWPTGTVLRVRFLGGTSQQQAQVEQYAMRWCDFANLSLVFDNAIDAEIRITFEDDGAWSYIGTDCLEQPREAPTMNFGWLNEGVVLHEFGHAIGLGHEHQNPQGGILWNEPEVINDLSGPPNRWDEHTIRFNVLDKYSMDQVNGTDFDPDSIMLYGFPAAWTLNNVATRTNNILSSQDKDFITAAYPLVEPGDLPVELPVITLPAEPAEIGHPGEEDLFRFIADSEGRYTIETEGPTDIVMKLFGPNNKTSLIKEDDDSGSDRNARIVEQLVPGEYFVQVRHYYSSNGRGKYGIRVMKSNEMF